MVGYGCAYAARRRCPPARGTWHSGGVADQGRRRGGSVNCRGAADRSAARRSHRPRRRRCRRRCRRFTLQFRSGGQVSGSANRSPRTACRSFCRRRTAWPDPRCGNRRNRRQPRAPVPGRSRRLMDQPCAAHERSAQKHRSENHSHRIHRIVAAGFCLTPHKIRIPMTEANQGKSRPFAAGLSRDITRKSVAAASERNCVLRTRGWLAPICDARR